MPIFRRICCKMQVAALEALVGWFAVKDGDGGVRRCAAHPRKLEEHTNKQRVHFEFLPLWGDESERFKFVCVCFRASWVLTSSSPRCLRAFCQEHRANWCQRLEGFLLKGPDFLMRLLKIFKCQEL